MALTKGDKAILRVYLESAKKGEWRLPADEAAKRAGVEADRIQGLIGMGYLRELGFRTEITDLGREQIKPWHDQPWHVWLIIILAAIATVGAVVAAFKS